MATIYHRPDGRRINVMSLPLLKDFSLMLTQWKSALDPILANPIILGTQLSTISLSTIATTVPHKLGRTQLGWFITDINAAATIFRTGDFNASNMVLTASAPCIVDIWVY